MEIPLRGDKNTGPFEAKFHMELPWDAGMKTCSNVPGHMNKMASSPIYGKNLQESLSSEPRDWWPWNLVYSIWYSSTTKFVQMTLGWPWPFLAHLSRRLTKWAYSISMVSRPSVAIRRLSSSSTLSNLNISEASWPILIKITGVGERLHKILGQIGSKLGFPWQQKAPIDL